MSNVSNLIHIVFCTKYRENTITNDHREDLYRMIWSLTKETKNYLVRIGGTPNHIHMLLDLSPKEPLSDVLRDIKSRSSSWMMSQRDMFPNFRGWAKGYFGTSVSTSAKSAVIEYIKSQQEHHKVEDFYTEIRRLCDESGTPLHPDDFTV